MQSLLCSCRSIALVSARQASCFARVTSGKVADMDVAAKLDQIVVDEILPESRKQPGFLGLDRQVCKNHLDYKVISKWSTVEALLASGDTDNEYMKSALAKAAAHFEGGACALQIFISPSADPSAFLPCIFVHIALLLLSRRCRAHAAEFYARRVRSMTRTTSLSYHTCTCTCLAQLIFSYVSSILSRWACRISYQYK